MENEDRLTLTTVPKDLYYHEIAYVRGLEAEIERLRAVVVRAKDALLDGQSTQWVHDLLVAALTVDTPRQSRG